MRKNVMAVIVIVVLITGCARQGGNSRTMAITTVTEYGKSLDWCHTNNLIAFGKMGDDSYYDVYVMNPDGSNERCLTCSGCPQRHNGNPAWHPSGEYIVFTAQNEDAVGDEIDRIAIPGRGVNCNLWVATNDGTTFWQLTNHKTSFINPKGIIHPQFSHDGNKLLWAERLQNKRGTSWGEWALKVADFISDDGCHLDNIQVYQPGETSSFYESHAFSEDDPKILFSGNLVADQLESGLDIYELDLKTQQLTRLTETFEDWDEHAHYSPDGQRIAWMSSTNLENLGITFDDLRYQTWGLKLKTELWIMDANGSNKQQLTSFNDPENPEYSGNVIVSDSAWSPDGTKIAATIAYKNLKNRRGYSSRIVLIELDFQEIASQKPLGVRFLTLGITDEQTKISWGLPVVTVLLFDFLKWQPFGGWNFSNSINFLFIEV
ncbi:MAG: PD40 domain-containing protein [Theionarchaea archaeon]|nr:PD40 domain-containing protein [Theionarchaea archaeon]